MARRTHADEREQIKLPVNEDWYANKVPCPECGLPRDPEYAKRAPCSCCGHWGLERKQRVEEEATEVFTEDGELVVLDRPAKREQPKAEPKVDKKKVEAITADLFLAALF